MLKEEDSDVKERSLKTLNVVLVKRKEQIESMLADFLEEFASIYSQCKKVNLYNHNIDIVQSISKLEESLLILNSS